jgi:EAL domain-containing protein (putative c-di-GMP-specific phosphodiesterase class I)
MQAKLDEHSELERELRQAMKRGQLQLHYQVQIDNAGSPSREGGEIG